jgi:hypothetical protein
MFLRPALLLMATLFPLTTQALIATQEPAPAPAPQGFDPKEFPTRKHPFRYEDRMTVTVEAPAYVNPGGKQGAFSQEGLRDSGKRGTGMLSNRSFAIQVPPHIRLKVTLECRRLRSFNVRFISDSFGRTEDPGLFVNRLHHRDDAAFYENKSEETRLIHCVVVGVEPMENEPFALVFTDY